MRLIALGSGRSPKNNRSRLRNYELVRQEAEERGNACLYCLYDGPALFWHHRDASEKVDNIGRMASRGMPVKRLLAELDKCDLVCANCHAEQHPELRFTW